MVAIVLHWAIAVSIVLNLYLGWKMNRLPLMEKFVTFQLHKSVGITILVLSLIRLAWRLAHRPPPYPLSMSRTERILAGSTHWIFYILMVATPLAGWIVVSASALNLPTLLFQRIPFPHIAWVHDLPIATRRTVENNVGELHIWLAYSFAALIVLHILAAMKHRFLQRDGVLSRMIPGMTTKRK